ncbi:hypothetical protein OO185_02445 [Prosthecochloris sp. SCSIO W1102]|uniref:hypothetical protein n=1 Tax=Prosthecochloris sp. SCSIO W1102 TaxID=2992243 RepID=UPI00223E47CC|nr:hypothetical protein [Prosthecochloris sp. SCSIO W1102]UZJ39980.1 hypothetical protein OO185_02445 [Prosthecochloris sp. SCSIO W1102]
MSSDRNEFRRYVGVALRLPFVAILAFLWCSYVWWWLALLGISVGILMLVIQYIAYPLLYGISYMYFAFINSDGKILPGYWEDYPDKYFELIRDAAVLGFRTLYKWLIDGFYNPL